MASRVSIHVGAPKSGTTYLQTILWANHERLREAGLLLPGRWRRDHTLMGAHVRNGSAAPRWNRLLKDIRAWDGPVLLSSEWFTLLEQRHVEKLVEALHPAPIDVVFTARRFVAAAPAAWQQTLKSGFASELSDFVKGMDGSAGRPQWQRWGWATMDPAEVLPRWEAQVPPERIHVVTVPPPGADREELWRRFCLACGIDPEVCDVNQAVPNESVGAEGARLLQRLGPALRKAIDADRENWRVQATWLRNYLSEDLLLRRRGSAIAVGPADSELLQERARRTAEALGASGYDIVGDVADLLDDTPKPGALTPDDVTDEALVDVALPLLAPMLGRLREETERAERAQAQLRRLRQ